MTHMENRIASVTDRLLQRVTLATKVWLSTALCLLLGLIILSIALQADQRRLTEQQLTALGAAISQQTAASSAALILAGDTLSLSINLQQLVAFAQISGAEVFDRKGRSLAQAGQPTALLVEQPILSGQTALGSVRIHLDPETDAYRLALPLTLAMGAITLLLLLATTLLLARHLNRPLQALLSAVEQLCSDNPIAPLDQRRHDQLGRIAQLLNQRFSEPLVEPAAPSIEPLAEPAPSAATTAERSPEPDNQTAAPGSAHQEPLIEEQAAAETETAATTLSSDSTARTQAATDTSAARSYLFYINHHVGGSDTLTSTEREQLLVRYRKALEQVARLYKGGFDEDPLGNWCVQFLPLSNDQSHGINALCAAQLFNALYRGINAQAIRHFSPVLNMKLVLLCGPSHCFDALAEDALLLSDLIQDNDLITHKALYQTPALQDRMLGSAQYRKFDDDTYLISALNADYQTLIDRQAEHFLRQGSA